MRLPKWGVTAFSQSDLDKSINELRDRQLTKWGDTEAKTMPKVQLNGSNLSVNGVVINDPARDPDVNPVLWEIRRERRIELIMEGRRGEDLRRWAKFEYLNSEDANGYPTMSFLGAYVNMADYPEISSKMIPARECSICSTQRIRVMRILKKGIFIIFVKRNFVYSRLVN